MKKRNAIAVLASTLVASTALAATAPSTTTATPESVGASSILERITVKHAATMYGPSVDSPMTTTQPGGSSPWLIENSLGVAYKLAPDVSVGANFTFLYTPVRGQNFELLDNYARVTHSKLINSGKFNLASDVRFYAPTREKSRGKGFITGIRANQIASYTVNDKLSVGTYTFLRGNLVESGGAMYKYSAYLAPSASYKLADRLEATVFAELYAEEAGAEGKGLFNTHAESVLLAPGVSWDVTSKINFNPHLAIQIMDPKIETTQIRFDLTASIL